MDFSPTKKQVLQLALLLWALPSAAYAYDDSIISKALWGILAVLVGVVVVFWGLSKLLFMLIDTLKRGESPETTATDEGVAAPTGAGKVQQGLAVRVLLLAFPLQLVSLWTAYPAASVARLVVPHGYYMEANPTASIARLMVPHGYYIYVLVTCALTSIPTLILVLWLWRTRRPSMALGIGLSGSLAIGGLAVLMMVQNSQPTGAVDVIPGVAGPDQLPGKVYTYVAEMPKFIGGSDSLQAFVRRNLHYPSLQPADRRSGTVHLRYVVDTAGNVAQVQLTKSMGPVFDDEAVRVVRSLPPFTPGRQNNEAVAVLLEIAVDFD